MICFYSRSCLILILGFVCFVYCIFYWDSEYKQANLEQLSMFSVKHYPFVFHQIVYYKMTKTSLIYPTKVNYSYKHQSHTYSKWTFYLSSKCYKFYALVDFGILFATFLNRSKCRKIYLVYPMELMDYLRGCRMICAKVLHQEANQIQTLNFIKLT